MEKNQRFTITSALPYTNGPIHIGHLAGAYLPADIYARYKRLCENDVAFICGSDEHGVAISIKARQEGSSVKSIIDKYKENYKAIKMGSNISKINIMSGYFKLAYASLITEILPHFIIMILLTLLFLFVNIKLGIILFITCISLIYLIINNWPITDRLRSDADNYYYNVTDNNLYDVYTSLLNSYINNNSALDKKRIDKDQNNYYKVTVKAFYDDIELELGLDERVVNYDDEYSNLRDLFKTYFMNNFILIADNKKIKYNFIGFEKKNDLLQFYIEFSLDDKTKKLSISNKILFSSFSNQKNLILFRSEFNRKSFIQSRNKHTNQISF